MSSLNVLINRELTLAAAYIMKFNVSILQSCGFFCRIINIQGTMSSFNYMVQQLLSHHCSILLMVLLSGFLVFFFSEDDKSYKQGSSCWFLYVFMVAINLWFVVFWMILQVT